MTAQGLLIRTFAPSDQEAARRLVNAGLGERFGVVDASFNPDLNDIAAHYLAHGHAFVVGEVDGALAGTAGLLIAPASPASADDAEGQQEAEGQMVRVSVRADLRGQRIGRRLVAHLVALAEARGLRRVWMETNADWASAMSLYVGSGFREYARRDGLVFLERMLVR